MTLTSLFVVGETENKPPRDGKVFTISENLKSFQGPVLNCMVSRKRRASYLNELVILEIRNNTSVIFQKFLFSCCKIKIEFVQCGKNPVKSLPGLFHGGGV
jgi:hypothetical protein